MALDPGKWLRINQLFEQALAQPHHEREGFIEHCSEDAELRSEVRRLLLNDSRAKANSFLSAADSPERVEEESSFAPQFKAGDMLAHRFCIVRYIAHGGMGEIYEAEDRELHEHVALKTILPIMAATAPHSIQRFKREALLSRRVTHPNVCRVFDFFRHAPENAKGREMAFVSMELLVGETLGERLRRAPRVSQEETLAIVTQVAAALDAAHHVQILHRDLKPGNIFLVNDLGKGNRVVVTDFGLATVLAGADPASENTGPMRELLGTPGYMSPEQLQNQDLTPASDIYSLGLVMFRMLTGRRPFEDETPFMERVRRVNEPAPSPRAIVPELSAKWEAVVMKCLERDPSRRFQSAGEIIQSLRGDTMVRTPRPRKAFHSVAVLPLNNRTGEPQMEYLGDGIAESIIGSLSRISKLRVMAYSTVLHYKGQLPDPRTLGRQLEVGYMLVGNVSRRGQALAISVELVDVGTGWQIWAEHYQRQFEDIFSIQEDIAREISSKLQLKLTGEDKRILAKKPTLNSEAYQLYLKGRHAWNKRTDRDVDSSIGLFHRAIQLDPEYAAAYAGLADAYTTQAFMNLHSHSSTGELMLKAQTAATTAVTLDESLAEAHASLGLVALRYVFDTHRAERSFQRSIALKPGNSVAFHWYGECLAAMGRSDEAVEQLRKALDLDPLSAIINSVLGAVLYFGGRYQEAIVQCRITLQEIQRDFWPALHFLGLAFEARGEYADAIHVLKQATEACQRNPMIMAALAHAYAVSGAANEARELLSQLRGECPKTPPIYLAVVAIGLGDIEMALSELRRAVEERSPWLVFLHVDPRFDPLRSDARYQVIAKLIGQR